MSIWRNRLAKDTPRQLARLLLTSLTAYLSPRQILQGLEKMQQLVELVQAPYLCYMR